MATSRIAVGTIPNKISYVYSKTEDVNTGCYWDIDFWENNSDKVSVYPTFPVAEGDEKTLERAEKWARDKCVVYDPATNKLIPDGTKVEIVTVENDPIRNVKVLSLEGRGNGGRAYKIVVDDKYYVDMREDVMMDVMLQVGIEPGGSLNGVFIWAKLGNQLRLVRIGSELHKLLEESNKKKELPKLKKNDFEIGGIYQSRKGDKGIFLGYVNTIAFKNDDTSTDHFAFLHTKIKKVMLFFEPYHHSDTAKELATSEMKNSQWFFKIMKTTNYIEKIGQVTIDKDYVKLLREHAVKEIKDDILEYTGHKQPEHTWNKMTARSLASNICYASTKLNISKYDEPMRDPFNIKKFLLFS